MVSIYHQNIVEDAEWFGVDFGDDDVAVNLDEEDPLEQEEVEFEDEEDDVPSLEVSDYPFLGEDEEESTTDKEADESEGSEVQELPEVQEPPSIESYKTPKVPPEVPPEVPRAGAGVAFKVVVGICVLCACVALTIGWSRNNIPAGA